MITDKTGGKSMRNSQTSHTPSYVIKMKAATVIVVVAIVFLVRTTGALQQTVNRTDADIMSGSNGISSAGLSVGKNGEGDQDTSDTSDQNSGSTNSSSPTPPQATGGSSSTPTTSNGTSGGSTPPPGTPTPVITYRDGTYYALGDYDAGNGQREKIGITLVLSNGVVTSTSATNLAVNLQSKGYQNDFIANYKPYVVGKSIKDLDLGKVSGSSLTPSGFNDAASNIRNQAS